MRAETGKYRKNTPRPKRLIFVNCDFSWFDILILVNLGLPSIKICMKKP